MVVHIHCRIFWESRGIEKVKPTDVSEDLSRPLFWVEAYLTFIRD
jgi:hypothetical protein